MALSKSTIQLLYRSLDRVTPLPGDCGQLCGQACCRGREDLGIYLFPGEEAMFTRTEDWLEWRFPKAKHHGFPPGWKSRVTMVRCLDLCPRNQRPLQCRFYPLAPHLLRQRELLLILDPVEVPYRCPLIEEEMVLQEEFVEKVWQAWQIMLQDDEVRALVEWESTCRERELAAVPPVVRSGCPGPRV